MLDVECDYKNLREKRKKIDCVYLLLWVPLALLLLQPEHVRAKLNVIVLIVFALQILQNQLKSCDLWIKIQYAHSVRQCTFTLCGGLPKINDFQDFIAWYLN